MARPDRSCGCLQTLRDLIRFCGDLGIPADSRIYARLVRFMGAFKTHYAIRGILPAYLRDGLVLDHLILESIIKASGRLQAFWYAWVSAQLYIP